MNTENVEWLNHLKEAVPPEGYGNKLSMYLIALEAWRRGIKVNFYTIDNPENKILVRYSLEYKGNKHFFESSLGDKLSSEAFDVCEYKDLTKKYLSDVGVKVPKGKVFGRAPDKNEISNYAESLTYPVVVKPLDANAGKGVFSNVDSEEYLLDVLEHLQDELNYDYILLEEFISGEEYRILTVDGKVAGAINRIPASVVGNGKDSIRQLIKKKNKIKAENPAINKKRIKFDKEVIQVIENLGYTEETVLEKDEQLFLRSKSSVSAGGDPVDVTDQISDEIKEMAEKATQTIPGLNVAGLDFIINPDSGEATIIEINTKPMLGLHTFPIEGKARDVVKPIVDYYFPETTGIERSNLHFDFDSKIDPLDNMTVHGVQVHPLKETGKYHTREFIINLEESEPTLTTEIRLEALKIGIHGYIKKEDTNQYRIVAASRDEETMQEFKAHFSTENDYFNVSSVNEKEWKYSVSTGFDIYRETVNDLNEKLSEQESKFKKLSTDMKKVQKNLKSEKEENQQTEEELTAVNEEFRQLQEKYNAVNDDYVSATMKLGEAERAFISSENILNEKLKSLETEYNRLWKKYKSTVNSKSWKVTKPLRRYNPGGRKKKK